MFHTINLNDFEMLLLYDFTNGSTMSLNRSKNLQKSGNKDGLRLV